MTIVEIKKQIKKEKNYIKRLKNKIAGIKFDIKATENAITMWNGMLDEAKRGEKIR